MVTAFAVLGALVTVWAIWRALAFAVPGFIRAISAHVTMYRGMKLNGRSPKWWKLPYSLLQHTIDLGGSMERRKVEITGHGYRWSTDGDRSSFRVGTLVRRGQQE